MTITQIYLSIINLKYALLLTFGSYRAYRLMLFVRHETQVCEYYESRKETGEAVNSRRNQTITENTHYLHVYTICFKQSFKYYALLDNIIYNARVAVVFDIIVRRI